MYSIAKILYCKSDGIIVSAGYQLSQIKGFSTEKLFRIVDSKYVLFLEIRCFVDFFVQKLQAFTLLMTTV